MTIRTVCVLGFGQMGRSIAKACRRSASIVLSELQKPVPNPPTTGSDMGESRAAMKEEVHCAESLDEALEGADLVIEAVIEDLQTKMKVLGMIDSSKALGKQTLITSNTSSLSIKKLSEALKNKSESFYGLHFFSPVEKMRLVEIITNPSHSIDNHVDRLKGFIKSLGKDYVTCADSHGFIVNRLLVPYLMEALSVAQESIASIEDIDKAMCLGAGHPLGPFSLMDVIGLDTLESIVKGWPGQKRRFSLLEEKIAKGHLGKKTGQGFYSYAK